MIDRHSHEVNKGLHSYTFKINQFTNMLNRRTHHPSAHASLNLPAAVDRRKSGAVTPVSNQEKCGSYYVFTALGALEGQYFIKTDKLVALLVQNIMDCSGKYGNMDCNRGLMDAQFQYIKDNKGVDTEASHPFEAQGNTCRFKRENDFVDLPKGNETALIVAFATV